ncbi:MAG: hypothetical protein ACHQ4H_10565 [Ktedonobacterales bacterium]
MWNLRLLRGIPPPLRYATAIIAALIVIAVVDVTRGDISGVIILGVVVVFIAPVVLLITLASRSNDRAPQSPPPLAPPDEPGVNGHSGEH